MSQAGTAGPWGQGRASRSFKGCGNWEQHEPVSGKLKQHTHIGYRVKSRREANKQDRAQLAASCRQAGDGPAAWIWGSQPACTTDRFICSPSIPLTLPFNSADPVLTPRKLAGIKVSQSPAAVPAALTPAPFPTHPAVPVTLSARTVPGWLRISPFQGAKGLCASLPGGGGGVLVVFLSY